MIIHYKTKMLQKVKNRFVGKFFKFEQYMFYLKLVESFDKYVQWKLDFNWNMLITCTIYQLQNN